MKWLKGKKTHISAILLALQAVFSVLSGEMSLIAFLSSPELTQLLVAFGISSMRAGISGASGNAS